MDVRVAAPPRPRPSWLDRRPDWRTDVAIALVLAVLQVGLMSLAAREKDEYGSLDALAYALLAIGPLALAFRRRFPVTVLLFTFAVTATYWTLDYPRGPAFFGIGFAVLTTVVIGYRAVSVAVAVASWVAFPWLPYLSGVESTRPNWLHMLALGAWLAGLFAVGEFIRVRRERMEEAWRVHEEEARRRASDERLRIARDLHDVVAHHISLMNVQAGVALHLMDEQPEQARTALTAIKQASGEALQELRSVLDILRQGDGADEQVPPRTPTPGLGELDTLVERATAAGLDVRAAVEGTRHPLPVSVDTTAYRIVQEALTNVARHAGAAAATIRVDYGDDDVVVEVEDDGRGAPVNGTSKNGGGNGIPNMRERAEALGGQLDAGPRPGGGFRVRAWLPVREPEREGANVIRVLLADDQALVRAGFRSLLDAEPDIEVVGEASDGAEAVQLASEHLPDVVLMDIRMPGVDGLEATRRIADDERLASVRVIILTTFDLDEYVFEALRAGAGGFLVKTTEPVELIRGVRVVAEGDALLSPGVTRRLVGEFAARSKAPERARELDVLTDREREVMALVAEGLTNDEIAERLIVSPATAKTHVSRAMIKLGARDRAQLVVFAYESGLVRPGWADADRT